MAVSFLKAFIDSVQSAASFSCVNLVSKASLVSLKVPSEVPDVGKRSPPKRYFHTKSARQTMKTKVISGKRFILTRSSGLIG